MTDEDKLSKLEHLKAGSRQLRGTIAEELANDSDQFSSDASQLLKHHGSYLQDNRDERGAKTPDNPTGKAYSCMVRTRIPGGKLTPEQFLAELDLGDKVGGGAIRITSRQGLQLHGVLKKNLRETIRAINHTMLTTFCACGDVERNVMCCPAPYHDNPIRTQMQEMTDRLAEHLKPKSTGYYSIWLEDEAGEKTDVTDFQPVEEPIYGERYLPRKFKTAVALPEDNCVDLKANDLGFLAVVEDDRIIGYNVYVGGGMGTTPSAKKTFPAVAKKMTFVTPDQVIDVATAVVKVQRDFGNRSDRKVARMKYLIADWGLERFKAKVEEYFGQSLPEPHPAEIHDVDDHMGWHEQGDGRWFLGVNIDNGRVHDTEQARIKTGLRTIVEKYRMPVRFTPLQSLILCDIADDQRDDINLILKQHGIRQADELTPLHRYAMACPALPTCGLSITESERVMPQLLESIEAELRTLGLENERLAVHMTGCPNGCARPYTPDIGLVGKTVGKYTIFLGGDVIGSRLAFIYDDLVPLEEIAQRLAPVFAYFKTDRQTGESFGDFCFRKGHDDLVAHTTADVAAEPNVP